MSMRVDDVTIWGDPDAVVSLLDGLADELAAECDWRDRALCAQTDPETFFPEKGGSTRQAKATCRRCAVRSECLQVALDQGERYGIWGGLSERERRGLRGGLNRPDWRPDLEGDRRAAEMQAQGATLAEIAEALGITERSVSRKLARHRGRAAA